jgi:hypothetical protein
MTFLSHSGNRAAHSTIKTWSLSLVPSLASAAGESGTPPDFPSGWTLMIAIRHSQRSTRHLRLVPHPPLPTIAAAAILGWGGEAERAIEWAERGIRLSPFDPWRFAAYHALTLGHFHRGRYQEAADSAYKGVQANPGGSSRICPRTGAGSA